MNGKEAVQLLKVARATWPGMSVVEGMAGIWAVMLDDVTFDDALAAVVRLGRRAHRFQAIADIRREIARHAGLTAPAEDAAWRSAIAVAAAGGDGRGGLHSAVRSVYDAMGGACGPLREGGTTPRAQFRDTYRQVQARHDDAMLDVGLGRRLIVAATPVASLPAAPAKPIELRDDGPRRMFDPAAALRSIPDAR